MHCNEAKLVDRKAWEAIRKGTGNKETQVVAAYVISSRTETTERWVLTTICKQTGE